MGTEAKAYLQEHYIPQLFEGLMTGLIYNRPDDPISFLEDALVRIRQSPDEPFAWDMFINKDEEPEHRKKRAASSTTPPRQTTGHSESGTKAETPAPGRRTASTRASGRESMGIRRVPSVIKAADAAEIPDVPVILFMGGPGGGKTKIAARVYSNLAEKGLVHVCMPDIVRNAMAKYKDKYPEWREANDKYLRGELIPNHLALALVKAEMGRHPDAAAFFLEGFPREARQVEDFERQIRAVNMALILDYDEKTLRDHMERRGLGMEIIDQKIKEFKQKTLPSAKYFDDQKLLHLIPGEKDEQYIFERMKYLVEKAMESGVPVAPTPVNNHKPPTAPSSHASRTPAPPPTAPRNNSVAAEQRASRNTGSSERGRRTKTPKSRAEETNGDVEREAPSRRGETSSSKRTESRGASRRRQETEDEPERHSSRQSRHSEAKQEEEEEEQSRAATAIEKAATPVHRAPSQPVSSAAPTPAAVATPQSQGRATTSKSFKGLPNNAPVILIVGAPGSNKGEYAKRIANKYDGYILLSMSELLRRKVAENKGDEVWEKIGKKMENGEQVPMKVCRELLYTTIEEHEGTSWGYVVEGYPRTLTQATDFESIIGRLDIAVLVDCTEQFCTKNVTDRYQKAITTGTQRPEDSADVFKTRMGFFKQNTLPMLKYLDDKSKLRVVRADADTVDGDADEDKVFSDISTAIDNALLIDGEASGSSLESSSKNP